MSTYPGESYLTNSGIINLIAPDRDLCDQYDIRHELAIEYPPKIEVDEGGLQQKMAECRYFSEFFGKNAAKKFKMMASKTITNGMDHDFTKEKERIANERKDLIELQRKLLSTHKKENVMTIKPNGPQIAFMPTEETIKGIGSGKVLATGSAVFSAQFPIGSTILYHMNCAVNLSEFSLVSRDAVLATLEY